MGEINICHKRMLWFRKLLLNQTGIQLPGQILNPQDNEGPVETFSNFGTEEGSLRPVPEQLDNMKHENIIPDRFTFVPIIQRSREGTKNIDRTNLRNFEAVASQHFGSFSDPDPVFVPFFVPYRIKQKQAGDQQLFQPFSFSLDL